MQPRLRRHCLPTIIAVITLAACRDLSTLPETEDIAPPDNVALVRGTFGNNERAGLGYECFTSVATPGGKHAYRYGRLPLRFPASVLHPGNATHRYRHRIVDDAGKVARMVNCVIPRSDQAVQMMNRRFGVPEHESRMQIEGCVSGGICILPPVSSAGGDCDPYMEADWDCSDGGGECLESVFDPGGDSAIQGCGGGGGDDGGGSGGGSDGGDDPDPGEPDTWDDGTGRPECKRDAAKHCITREVSPEEWELLESAIEALPESPVECKGAKDALTSLYGQGRASQRIRFWDGYDKPTPTTQRFGQNLSDTRGRYIEYDSYHVWVYPTLLIHEGLHAWLSQNPDNAGLVHGPNGISNEEWVEQMAQGCTGPASGWQ